LESPVKLEKLKNILDEETKKRKFEIQVDDEYQTSGNQDPKILLTTAHDPSDRLQRFAKELRFIFPNSQRINRGTQTLGQIGKKFF
jgi:U3 small nucleolar ribonucleoprotein protein IMP4